MLSVSSVQWIHVHVSPVCFVCQSDSNTRTVQAIYSSTVPFPLTDSEKTSGTVKKYSLMVFSVQCIAGISKWEDRCIWVDGLVGLGSCSQYTASCFSI